MSHSPRRFAGIVVLCFAAACCWLTATAAPASAHAVVVSSSPADGSHLDEGPATVSVELNEPVSIVAGSASILGANGTRDTLRSAQLADGGRRVVLTPAHPPGDGAYLATVRVVSADTHVVSLAVRFTVGSVTELGAMPAPQNATPTTDTIGGLLAKVAVYAGTVLTAGLLLAARWVWPETPALPRFRRTYRIGSAVLVAGLAARLILLARQQSGGAGWSVPGWTTVLDGKVGIALAAAAATAVAAGLCPPGTRWPTQLLGYLGGACAIVSITLAGHGGAGGRWPYSLVATLAHVYTASVWLGGIALLAALRPAPLRIERWHRVVVGHLVVLAASGVTLAFLQVAPLKALVHTAYGLTLTAKVAAVACTVVAGYGVLRTYRRRRVPAEGGGRRRLLLVECALAVIVMSLTSILSSLTPARDSFDESVTAHLDFGNSQRLDVRIDSIRRGEQGLTVVDPAPAGTTPTVDVELSSADANVARLPVDLTESRTPRGHTWRSRDLIVPAAGHWRVTVRLDGTQGPRLASFSYRVR
ncbi:copper resistance protein CopC [Gordonia sp. DT30]|uniref:copper resistance CopC/CopD family protein n=1 Tax=Gordonia sp. DT30 TaxID=3416546 RepID=UPI003CECBC58